MLARYFADRLVPAIDLLLAIPLLLSALLMKLARRLGIWRMPIAKRIFEQIGIYPIRDHYYEPMFNHQKYLRHSLRAERFLPGLDMNEAGQLEWLSRFDYANELEKFPSTSSIRTTYHYDNPNFAEGDAECLYSLIRLCKPSRIIEIGSGFSTLIAKAAVAQNQSEHPAYQCIHQCIEPYEMQWLDVMQDIEVIRKKVEEIDQSVFRQLQENDILFIDSSHIIRPQSDVLTEFLEILPQLNAGVLIHIHDIFTPCDYLDHWLLDEVKFWNEQYLLEAFLSCNPQFEIIAALNYLSRHHSELMKSKFPMMQRNPNHPEPRSFWIRKIS